jgi:hypothetical protein
MFLDKSDESEENKDIEKAARRIAGSDWSEVILFLLRTFRPLFYIGGELGRFFGAPFLLLFEDEGFKFINTFEKRENVEKLIERVEELENEAEKAEKDRKKA